MCVYDHLPLRKYIKDSVIISLDGTFSWGTTILFLYLHLLFTFFHTKHWNSYLGEKLGSGNGKKLKGSMFLLTLTSHIKELAWCAFYLIALTEFIVEQLNAFFIKWLAYIMPFLSRIWVSTACSLFVQVARTANFHSLKTIDTTDGWNVF